MHRDQLLPRLGGHTMASSAKKPEVRKAESQQDKYRDDLNRQRVPVAVATAAWISAVTIVGGPAGAATAAGAVVSRGFRGRR